MSGRSFSILISTCRDSILEVENVFSDVLKFAKEIIIVHQLLHLEDTYSQFRDSLQKKYPSIKIILDKGKGLSCSRNIAINHATSDYVFLSDDDNKFCLPGVKSTINLMVENSLDISIGRIKTEGGLDFKAYSEVLSKVSLKNAGSVSSLEICIHLDFIKNNNLLFDERFGLGTNLPSCEEFIFITDAIKLKANITRTPFYINIHPLESSGKNLSDPLIIQAKGAAFKRVFGFFSIPILVMFLIKKSTNHKSFLFIAKNLFKGFI